MKRKTLITIMVVILSLVLVLTAVSCNKPKPGPGPGPDPDPPVVKAKFTDVFNSLLKSADKTIDNVSGVTEAAYYAATIYFEIESEGAEPIKYEITAKGNFDEETLANNAGFIEIKDTAKNQLVLSVYVADQEVYLGESFTVAPTTAKPLNWVKLDQVGSSKFIAGFFAKVPDFIETNLKVLHGKNILSAPDLSGFSDKAKKTLGTVQTVLGFVPMVGDVLFDYDHPATYNKTGNIDGEYVLGIKMDAIGSVLQMDVIAGFLTSIPAEYLPIINMALPTLLGLQLQLNDDGKYSVIKSGVTPEIDIIFNVADGAMNKIGFSYEKKDDPATKDVVEKGLKVAFGIKNLAAKDAVNTDSFIPSYVKVSDIKQGAVKVSLDLGIGQKDLAVHIDAYVLPELTVDYTEADGFSFDFAGLKGYANATFDGQDTELAAYYDAQKGFAIDLAGLYEMLDVELEPGMGTVYYNKDLALVEPAGPASAEDTDPRETSDNIIDELINAIMGAFAEGGDMLGLVTDNLGTVMDIVGTVFGAVDTSIDEGTDGDGIATLDVLALMDALKVLKMEGSDDLLLDSEWAKYFLGQYPAYYLDKTTVIEKIATALDLTVPEFEEGICMMTGIELEEGQTLNEYILENGLDLVITGFFGETADGGAGFAVELKAGNDSIVNLGLKVELITVDALDDAVEAADIAIADFDFDAPAAGSYDLSETENWEQFLGELSYLGMTALIYGEELK